MGVLKMLVAGIILIMVVVTMGAPFLTILNGLNPLISNASTTMKYGTDTNGGIIAVTNANAAGDLVPALLAGVFLFMIIGFIVWLVMRAPNEPDFYEPVPQDGGRFR